MAAGRLACGLAACCKWAVGGNSGGARCLSALPRTPLHCPAPAVDARAITPTHPPPPLPPPGPRTPLPSHAQVLLEVARSVEYLHERKLLHCDLKVGRTLTI